MLVYPHIAHALFSSSEQVGVFLGTAIHDTSQVMGAAITYSEIYNDDVALKVAALTKLTRNLFLAGCVLIKVPVVSCVGYREYANYCPFFRPNLYLLQCYSRSSGLEREKISTTNTSAKDVYHQ